MIVKITDIDIVNSFLANFNQKETDMESPFRHYIGYKLDNNVVSFLAYSIIYDRIEIDYIYTKVSYRCNACASKLVEWLIDFGVHQKCLNITLEVNKNNFTAIKFYHKHGFREVSVRPNYYNGEDGLLMIRELV